MSSYSELNSELCQIPVDVIVVGSGNAALCAAIAACESGAKVVILEKGDEELAGGNSKYTAGAMRFVYQGNDDLTPLLKSPDDPRLALTDFGKYDVKQFESDLLKFNDGRSLSSEQNVLINQSYSTLLWLASHGIKFEPIYSRQSFEKNGKSVFWGGLTLAAENEGVGLVEAELKRFLKLGGLMVYNTAVVDLVYEQNQVTGVIAKKSRGDSLVLHASSVVLGCGGFESNRELRKKYLGERWGNARVRGTPHNTGDGLEMAFKLGAQKYGYYQGCHATPMDLHMQEFGNLDLPHKERKHYRKICYFLGIMINTNGKRFVDEGKDFRNYTYAQFGREILMQPDQVAWQIFDSKVDHLLYSEYQFEDASFVQADTLETLIEKLDGVRDKSSAYSTLQEFNDAVDEAVTFDPTKKDGKSTANLTIPKSNWAQKINTPPFKAYPVTAGITFTYGGLKIDEAGCVLREDDTPISGLYACGELVGGVFYNGYPGGSGLTSGAVFGRRAGRSAALSALADS